MNKRQENILSSLFERSFKLYKALNYTQVAYLFSCVSWLIEPTDEELKEALDKRSVEPEEVK